MEKSEPVTKVVRLSLFWLSHGCLSAYSCSLFSERLIRHAAAARDALPINNRPFFICAVCASHNNLTPRHSGAVE